MTQMLCTLAKALPKPPHTDREALPNTLCEEEVLPEATILCIDDNASILVLHKNLFESKGYTVLTAPDDPTGIALTRKHAINAIVLDSPCPSRVAELAVFGR